PRGRRRRAGPGPAPRHEGPVCRPPRSRHAEHERPRGAHRAVAPGGHRAVPGGRHERERPPARARVSTSRRAAPQAVRAGRAPPLGRGLQPDVRLNAPRRVECELPWSLRGRAATLRRDEGETMPIIQCDIREGRSPEQKRALAEAITRVVHETIDAPLEYIY